jgi:hypothetical protein
LVIKDSSWQMQGCRYSSNSKESKGGHEQEASRD